MLNISPCNDVLCSDEWEEDEWEWEEEDEAAEEVPADAPGKAQITISENLVTIDRSKVDWSDDEFEEEDEGAAHLEESCGQPPHGKDTGCRADSCGVARCRCCRNR